MKKFVMLFLCGGGAYTSLELLWRHRTHISMFFAGGSCLALIHTVCNKLQKRRCLLVRCATGSALITGVELLTGLLFNRDKSIWDYSRVPFNLKGQVCLGFSCLWGVLTLPAIKIGRAVDKAITRA